MNERVRAAMITPILKYKNIFLNTLLSDYQVSSSVSLENRSLSRKIDSFFK